jgi:hypothetical protein
VYSDEIPITDSIVAFSLASYHTMVETTNQGDMENLELPLSDEQLEELIRNFNEKEAIKGVTLSFHTGVNGEIGEFLASHTSDVSAFRNYLNNRITNDKQLIIFGSDENHGTYFFSLRCRET